MKISTVISMLSFLFFTTTLSAQNVRPDSVWTSCNYLMGDWIGEGDGATGKGSGEFSFHFDLDKNILVRKNHSQYAGEKGKPATHDDMMIIYPSAAGVPDHAIYFDNEGHTINYTIPFTNENKTIVFTSEKKPGAVTFRLSYIFSDASYVTIKFEVATPNNPDTFRNYISGTAHKK